MSVDETGSEGEEPGAEEDELAWRPYGARPYGARPYGAKPYGARPYGARPYGARPYGARPYGARPYGARPYGARPYGAKPYGARPYGARPYGAKPGPPSAERELLDAEAWSADLEEIVCDRSAVIRLGATFVSGEYELKVASFDAGTLTEQDLRPRDTPVRQDVAVPNRLLRDLAANPELASGLKADLGVPLASEVDQRMLAAVGTGVGSGTDPLDTARSVVTAVRSATAVFRNPGWILSPQSLDRLTILRTVNGLNESTAASARSLDSFEFLRLDGANDGIFLGFPLVISEAAGTSIYLGADWREAWIGIDRGLPIVDISSDDGFAGDATVFRASMSYDVRLRRTQAFAGAPLP